MSQCLLTMCPFLFHFTLLKLLFTAMYLQLFDKETFFIIQCTFFKSKVSGKNLV